MRGLSMDWTTLGLVSHVVLWAVVLVQVALTLALARLVGQLMSRRFPALGARVIDPGPEIGATLDGWEGTDLAGERTRPSMKRLQKWLNTLATRLCAWLNALTPTDHPLALAGYGLAGLKGELLLPVDRRLQMPTTANMAGGWAGATGSVHSTG